VKKGYKLPRPMMTNADVTRLINSDEVQSVVLPPKETATKAKSLKKNPLKNLGAMVKLNPHAASTRRNAILLSVSGGDQGLAGVGFRRCGRVVGTRV
jgi:large subunit ribosomal protein L4e